MSDRDRVPEPSALPPSAPEPPAPPPSAPVSSVPPPPRRGVAATWQLILPALAALALELAAIDRYGWFRDELYYVACGRRLAFGYVDHPPLVAVAAWLSRALLGDSLPALRLLPALIGAAVVYLSGRLARELGGGRFAALLAATCALVAPRLLGTFHTLSTNTLEILLWTLAALVLARTTSATSGAAGPRRWLLFGTVAGLALESKHSALFLGLGVAAGLLLTANGRAALRRPWVYLGGLLAAALFLPNLWWEAAHGWPTLEFLRNAQAQKNAPLAPPQFFLDQLLAMQPLTAPVWIGGFAWLLAVRRARPFRLLGWTALTVTLVLLAFRAKGYYMAPIFPLLYAAGAVAIERLIQRPRPAGAASPQGAASPIAAAAAGLIVLLLAGGALTAPLALPLLPVGTFVRYQAALGLAPTTTERWRLAELPQHYADMFGWPQLTLEVARAVHALPEQQAGLCVLCPNYGDAGALEELGRRFALPPAVSGHNNYFLWGPDQCGGDLLVILGGSDGEHRTLCTDLRRAGTVRAPYAMPYENGRAVWICRLRQPLQAVWPTLKHYD